MKRVLTVFLIVTALFAGTTYANAATGRQLADSAIAALKDSVPGSTSKTMLLTLGYSWLEVNYNYDLAECYYPITIDFVGSNFAAANKVIYLLPGGGVNFSSSFFTPIDNNLAQFFRQNGYLVVGITPREDVVPSGISYAFMAEWGLGRHQEDIQKVISTIQARINKPYRVLGHSFGAAYALDYASKYMNNSALASIPPEKVIALDIYSLDPNGDYSPYSPESSYEGFFNAIMSGAAYVDSSYTQIKSLMLISMLFPKIDSGTARPVPYPGNFTFESLLYFTMVDSRYVPGIDTTDWPLVQSYAAGFYTFRLYPLFDTYTLLNTDMCTLREASFKVGSGLVPLALYRDYFAVNAGDAAEQYAQLFGLDAYNIVWDAITVPVVWINTQFGYGGNQYGFKKIPSNKSWVQPNYGHLDILASRTAQSDVWDKYLK